MTKTSYSGYRFPPEIIHQAIWLYLRFTLSFRDVEDLLAERGIAISYETVRRWVNHFGPIIAAKLRKRRPRPHSIWHLDEVYLKIDGRMLYLWRAVDAEGEVLDVLVQSKRNKHAALKLMRKLLRKYAVVPERLVTDDLRSYRAATLDLGIDHLHDRGRWKNNRAAPMAVADSCPPDYRRDLFALGQTMLPGDHELAGVDPHGLDGRAIVPFEALLLDALAAEEANPSYENRPDSVDDPRARRETFDPDSNARKIEYSAKTSFIKDLSREGRRVLRLMNPNTGAVLLGGPFSKAPGY